MQCLASGHRTLEAFVFLSIFQDVHTRGWHLQAAPAADRNRFTADVLPRTIAVLDTLPADPTTQLRALVLGYHSSI